jgi:hypothetical protein
LIPASIHAFSFGPIVTTPPLHGILQSITKIDNEALLERKEQMLLRFEVEVERAFGDIGGRHNFIDTGGGNPFVQEQPLGRIHQFFAPHLRRFGAGAASSRLHRVVSAGRCRLHHVISPGPTSWCPIGRS